MPAKTDKVEKLLERIATALERANPVPEKTDFNAAPAFIWTPERKSLKPVKKTGALPLNLLVGVEDQAETLLQNTRQFAGGFASNNALLWGARGMGKSSLIKAVHAEINKKNALKLIEIHREDLPTITGLLDILRKADKTRFILFCDDLSFDEEDAGYKSLKALLEGGLETRPGNVIFYATSNRRHLMPRGMIENEQRAAIHGGEAIDEKVSLSDRFGLWLGFYPAEQPQYLEMVEKYAHAYKIPVKPDKLHKAAIEWAATRGGRSGRVAWQFINDLAGKNSKKI